MTRIIPIRLSLSNAFLVLGTRPILVDTGSPGEIDLIVKALAQHGITPRDLALILHTHGHVDHAGTTRQLKALSGAPVAIHAKDAQLLQRGENGLVKPYGWLGRIVLPFVMKPFEGLAPDLLLEEDADLSAYGVQVRTLSTPGHTAGSISILTDLNEVIVGDVLMGGFTNGAFGADQPGYHFFVNDLEQVHASLRKLVGLAPARWYVGHGGPLALNKIQTRFAHIL